MPHLPYEPATSFQPGAQWAASADRPESLTRTSTRYRGGRGFSDCDADCTDPGHHHAGRGDDTDAIISRLIRRLKAQGSPEAPWVLR